MTVIDLTEEPDLDPRIRARALYFRGYAPADIAKALHLKYQTVDSWKRRDDWDNFTVAMKAQNSIDIRLCVLIAKEEKTDRDFKEIEVLTRALARTAQIQNYQGTKTERGSGKESDLNPKIKNRNKAKKEKKNAFSEDEIAKLRADFEKSLFAHQKVWWKNLTQRIRNILKSRQIGATWYFAREAFLNALETGDNQIFLSASKAQAHVFKDYIKQWVMDVLDRELTGDPIKLANGATLYFLGTNSKTAQSYHGHVYMDEYFWIPKFKEFRKVASGMAAHKKWRQTYFSTPSAVGHQAYPFWSGKDFNQSRKEQGKADFDVSHAALKDGARYDDGQWRQIVTVEDAAAGGCDLFDLPTLRIEYSEQDYANLFMCQFIDDHASFFKLSDLLACAVDTWSRWRDVDIKAHHPYDSRPVWIGYDPSRSRDNASIAVVAPPENPGGFYRVLERININNLDFETQAEAIRRLTERYNVAFIGIDTSSIGIGVFELVQKFYPSAMAITYNVDVKSRLVLKAEQIISRRRLQFDAGYTDIPLAFLSIRRTMTASGRQATFQASRSAETGHADVAWAIMHALQGEGGLKSLDNPDDFNTGVSESIVEFC